MAEDPYAKTRQIALDAAIKHWRKLVDEQIKGSPEDHATSFCDAVLDALKEAGLLLPGDHPLTQGEFYTWYYEDGYENDLMGSPIKFPPQSSWKGPARPGHNPIVKVERKRWYISHWDEEPEDCSEEAKATPYVDPWTHDVIE